MTHKPSIEISNIGKAYTLWSSPKAQFFSSILPKISYFKEKNTFWVMRDLNLTINRGERLAIIGENGAGKSTLLKILSETIPPTEGEIKIYGEIEALLQAGTGFHPELTGRENIRAFFSYKNVTAQQIIAYEKDIAEFTELAHYLDQPIRSYSLGMLARLSFATATCLQPDILIVDEVLGAGDAYFSGKSLDRMKQLTSNEHSTVLFVSHDFAILQKLCNRAVWLHDGAILADGEPSQVIKQYLDYIDERTEIRHRVREYWDRSPALRSKYSSDEMFRFHRFCVKSLDTSPEKLNVFIKEIKIYNNNNLISAIQVGHARDNDTAKRSFLVDNFNETGWKSAEKNYNCFKRALVLSPKFYAPFICKEPITSFQEKSDIKVVITHTPLPCNANIVVQYFDETMNIYKDIGCLKQTDESYQVEWVDSDFTQVILPLEGGQNQKNEQKPENTEESLQQSTQEYNAQGGEADNKTSVDAQQSSPVPQEELSTYALQSPIWIEKVYFKNSQNENKRVFIAGESLSVHVDYKLKSPVQDPVFAITFHSVDGTQMDHKNTKLANINIGTLQKLGSVVFKFDPLRIGPGEYVVSVAILKYLNVDDWLTVPPVYDRHNRSYRITVMPDPKIKMNLGVVLQDCEISIQEK